MLLPNPALHGTAFRRAVARLHAARELCRWASQTHGFIMRINRRGTSWRKTE